MAYNHDKGWCWYNLDNNICFIGVPKNASTSIRNGLNLNKMDNYFTLSDDVKNNLNLITVLRDPLDRLVSSYLEVLVRLHDSPKTGEKKFYHMKESIERFEEFISELERDTYDAHVETQFFYVTDDNGDLLPFYKILSFDCLDEQINILKNELVIGGSIPHLNKKSNNKKNMVYSYLENDVSLLKRIKKIYSCDYNLIEKIKNKV
tara:strand:+ start:1143 stop:1757 length:615 start_codon:yes stop_codon:yes gene_type:complete